MASQISINPDSRNDIFARHKRPIVGLQRYSNGKVTCVVNIDKIAAAFGRSTDDVIKFVKLFLKTAITKNPDGIVCIKSGNVTTDDVEAALDKFATMFVLCTTCNSPDTQMIQSTVNTRKMRLRCSACGAKWEKMF